MVFLMIAADAILPELDAPYPTQTSGNFQMVWYPTFFRHSFKHLV